MATSKVNKGFKDEWLEVPVTVSVTTGSTADSFKVYKNGTFLMFVIDGFSRAVSTAEGGNLWGANVSGLPSEFISMSNSIYYDGAGIIVYFNCTSDTTAQITARVIAASVPANGKTSIRCITRIA